MTLKIEELWNLLRREATGAQRRIDSAHPLDLYADFEQPDRPGLVLFCEARPHDAAPLRAIGIERRQRHDGRWSLRIFLAEPRLLAVFAELCRDIIEFTRSRVDPAHASGPILSRIERWRSLFQMQSPGLSRPQLRGLIGELLVLEASLSTLGPDAAVSAWTGPLGTDQDFQLPNGSKVEVKAIDRDAHRVAINGLGQLDGGRDSLRLAVVRLEDTGRDASDAITASRLVDRLRTRLVDAPEALRTFETMLGFAGWNDDMDTDAVAVRMHRIDEYKVDPAFPRLITATVPIGVVDASYTIDLPPPEVA